MTVFLMTRKLAVTVSVAAMLTVLAAGTAGANDASTPIMMKAAEKKVEAPAAAVETVKDVATPKAVAPAPVPMQTTQAVDTTKALTVMQSDKAMGFQRMSLRDAVGVGVKTNPEYGVVANNRRATDEELRQARALYLPSVDFRADTGMEYSNDPGTRAGTGDDSESLYRYETGLTLTQLLFDGWKSHYEEERQSNRVLSASNRVREASELIGLGVIEAYLDVIRQRELLKIAQSNVADHLTLQAQIQDSATAGRTTQADVEQARARVAASRSVEASTREALRVAEASYIEKVGVAPIELVMPQTPANALTKDVEQEVKIALHQSPTIDIFEADVQVAHSETEGSKSEFYPKLDLQVNGRNGHNLGGVEGRDTSASALVVMNWNLYRGGGDTARVREQINREAQAKEQRAKAARGIENDVRQTWARMESAGERARQFSAQADANTEVVKSYKDQFDLNRRTLLDVLDAQNELFVSKSNVINAQFLEMFAVYRLVALKGELMKTLGVEYPRESDPAKM